MPDVRKRLEAVRRNLLDLSRRNRLLNFRPDGRGTIRLVDELPQEIYRLLALEQKALQFLAMEESQRSADRPGPAPAPDLAALDLSVTETPGEVLFDLPEMETPAPEAAPEPQPAPAPVPAHHTDRWLQTDLPGPQLQRRLLNLSRQAESALQERGSNVLYLTIGLVEWRQAEGDAVSSLAPLLLVPVELFRRNVRRRHAIRLFDEEIVVNPSLIELCRRQFALDLPPFDGEGESAVSTYLDRVAALIADTPGWSLRSEMHVGIFSFARHLMYLDLDDARWPPEEPLSSRALIQALLSGTTLAAAPGEDITAAQLDAHVHPRDSFQVVDADASQLEAVVAAGRGANLVIEGPPGTGKSQTITNIIAECLAAGRSVLFVAEKAAALDVVKSRLERVGLGRFVAELHSRKASKRAFAEDLARSLAADPPEPPAHEDEADDLVRARDRLNEYVEALHSPVAPLNRTVYEAIGMCAQLAHAPEAAVAMGDVLAWDQSRLAQAQAMVDAVTRAVERAGDVATHPWRGANAVELPLSLRQELPGMLESILAALAAVREFAPAVAAAMSARKPQTMGESRMLLEAAAAILDAVAVETQAPGSAPASAMAPDIEAIVTAGRRIQELRRDLSSHWADSAERLDWEALAARRQRDLPSPLRWLKRSWWSDRSLIRAHQRHMPATEPPARRPASPERISADLLLLNELRRLRQELSRVLPPDAQRRLPPLAADLEHAFGDFAESVSNLFQSLSIDGEHFCDGLADDVPFERWHDRITSCASSIERISDWIAYASAAAALTTAGLGPFLDWALAHRAAHAPPTWADVFTRQFYRLWADGAVRGRKALRDFHGSEHESLIERFCRLDEERLALNRQRLAALVAERAVGRRSALTASSALGVLQAEIRRKRGHKPIRQLLASNAGPLVQTIKPCFMMSPISLAQFLEPARLRFDVVIFDEASQVTPEDALGAIARASQIILVGDERQLPPTDFFEANLAAEDSAAENDDDAAPAASDLESVLGLGQVCVPPQGRKMLRWHYRSRHDSLITFSNVEFYERFLRVFPSPVRTREHVGLSFRYVEGGVYQRGRGAYNRVEARAVAEAVMTHAREHPQVSLGVGAFSVNQQRAIEDEVERLRRESDDAAVEQFFAEDREEPFFVKNLETIQGDERDVILLSVGYGPDEDGRLTMNFGPLNQDLGWRRLNVLITRARLRCVVFSSIRAAQMRVDDAAPRGVRALRGYLAFAEAGTLAEAGAAIAEGATRFEACVRKRLESEGLKVDAAIGDAGYRLDLAIADAARPGEYLLGVECDGQAYRSCHTARDRDRIRPMVLDRLGWRIVRVWSTDWLRQPQATWERLVADVRMGQARPAAPEPTQQSAPQEQTAPPAPPASEPSQRPAEPALPFLPGMVPYQRFAIELRGDRDDLLRAPSTTVASALARIVRVEGPIHRDELMRIGAALYATRVSGRAKEHLAEALTTATQRGLIDERGDFFWPAGLDRPPVRWRGAGAGESVTDADMICIEEIAEAVRLVVEHDHGVPRADLPAVTIRALGFTRVGPQLADRGEFAVQHALATGLVRAEPSGVIVAAGDR